LGSNQGVRCGEFGGNRPAGWTVLIRSGGAIMENRGPVVENSMVTGRSGPAVRKDSHPISGAIMENPGPVVENSVVTGRPGLMASSSARDTDRLGVPLMQFPQLEQDIIDQRFPILILERLAKAITGPPLNPFFFQNAIFQKLLC
jgi:hypothetical protein